MTQHASSAALKALGSSYQNKKETPSARAAQQAVAPPPRLHRSLGASPALLRAARRSLPGAAAGRVRRWRDVPPHQKPRPRWCHDVRARAACRDAARGQGWRRGRALVVGAAQLLRDGADKHLGHHRRVVRRRGAPFDRFAPPACAAALPCALRRTRMSRGEVYVHPQP